MAAQGIRFVRRWAVVVLAFLLGFLALYRVEAIGVLGFNEILLVAIAPFLLPTILRSRSVRKHWKIILVGFLYLASQIAADLYRGSDPHDYLRGWARIVLLLLSFTVTSALFVRNAAALIAFAIGAHLVGPLGYLQNDATVVTESSYKLQIGPSVSMLVFLILSFKSRMWKFPSTGLPIAAGIFAFFNGARSLAAVTLLALGSYWVGRFRRMRGHGVSKGRLLRPAIIFLLAGWGIFEGYRYAAPSGMLGEDAIVRYEQQSQLLSTGSFSILSGRMEILFAGPKILASPLLGYGSWPKDIDYVFARAMELGLDPDDIIKETEIEPGLIPSHSHLFGAWLEAGIFGALFWAMALLMAADILLRQKFTRHPALAPLVNYFVVYFVWDLLFSPFGAERRVWNGFLLAWMAAIYYKSRDSKHTHEHGHGHHSGA